MKDNLHLTINSKVINYKSDFLTKDDSSTNFFRPKGYNCRKVHEPQIDIFSFTQKEKEQPETTQNLSYFKKDTPKFNKIVNLVSQPDLNKAHKLSQINRRIKFEQKLEEMFKNNFPNMTVEQNTGRNKQIQKNEIFLSDKKSSFYSKSKGYESGTISIKSSKFLPPKNKKTIKDKTKLTLTRQMIKKQNLEILRNKNSSQFINTNNNLFSKINIPSSDKQYTKNTSKLEDRIFTNKSNQMWNEQSDPWSLTRESQKSQNQTCISAKKLSLAFQEEFRADLLNSFKSSKNKQKTNQMETFFLNNSKFSRENTGKNLKAGGSVRSKSKINDRYRSAKKLKKTPKEVHLFLDETDRKAKRKQNKFLLKELKHMMRRSKRNSHHRKPNRDFIFDLREQ